MKRAFVRDIRGAIAAEFALVLPIMLLFLFGIMDVGYYAWAINQGEKATQMGARWAVSTEMVATGLANYSFAVQGGIPQGTPVPKTSFEKVICTDSGCTCEGPCAFGIASDPDAFDLVFERMHDFKTTIEPGDVQIEYSWSGLGYSGDPNGPDVAPIVTVRLTGMEHRPLFGHLTGPVALPDFAYSLTAEDSDGDKSN